MKVWVYSETSKDEGAHIIGVYSSKAGAIRAIWTDLFKVIPKETFPTDFEVKDNVYSLNGLYFYSIEEFDVRK